MTGFRILPPATALALALLAVVAVLPAAAAYPGPSGEIYLTATAPGQALPDVWSIDPRGGAPTNLTDLPGGPGQGRDPSASADGSRLAFVVGEGAGAEIWTMAADGSQPVRLTADGFADVTPALSPDGAQVAFASTRGGDPDDLDLRTMSSRGGEPQLLLASSRPELHPQYAPDAAHLALVTEDGGDLDIAYVPATGGPHPAATVVTGFSDLDESTPSIKPDGSRVAYSQSSAGGPADIYDVFFNGTDFLAVAADPAADERDPAYSPDGTELAYVRDGVLVVAAAGGAGPQPLDLAPATAPADPDWAVGSAPDRLAPQTTITRAPEGRARGRVTIRFRSSEQGSSFACRLDRRPYATCTSPWRRRPGPGPHGFRVRATDAAGNTDRSAARARFRVGPG